MGKKYLKPLLAICFPGGSDKEESALMQETWVGKIPVGGHGNPLQYSCLENPHEPRSLAGYSPWGHRESDMTEHTRHRKYYHSASSEVGVWKWGRGTSLERAS